MFCFGFLRIFGGKSQKGGKKWKSRQKIGLLRHSVGNPRRGVDLLRNEAGVPKGHPWGMPQRRYCS